MLLCVCIIRQFNMSDVYTLLYNKRMHTFILLKIVGTKYIFETKIMRERERERERENRNALLTFNGNEV